jgi:copper chaperone NosL
MINPIRAIGIFWCVGAMMLSSGLCAAAGAGDDTNDGERGRKPRQAELTLTDQGLMRIGPKDRCPVCGMFPFKRPEHAAALVLDDGRTFYFCANRCLLRAWRETKRYLNVHADAIERMVVLDFFSGTSLDAQTAMWVAGSDVIGPMGPSLATLRTSEDVVRFQARHGGATVFQMKQIDDALWAVLFAPRQ